MICFGARVIGPELAKAILGEWMTLEYIDGPSTPKVQEIIALEEKHAVTPLYGIGALSQRLVYGPSARRVLPAG